ncbi:proline-rich receptor-like protein kinase PERK2 [Brassica napus]|uniref:proline-rich receptor-like protein kinase PERK2 n=1 Tax=Brassica napus TaxID=3708 RepID=UPI0020787045|nr:proline-rich receptor-like protein kinase PERK2 [Brassica napus]
MTWTESSVPKTSLSSVLNSRLDHISFPRFFIVLHFLLLGPRFFKLVGRDVIGAVSECYSVTSSPAYRHSSRTSPDASSSAAYRHSSYNSRDTSSAAYRRSSHNSPNASSATAYRHSSYSSSAAVVATTQTTRSDNAVHPPPSPGLALGTYQGTFTYEELARATNGFSEANWLGQGGFGYVYRGILRNGKEIAVKQLKAGSAQGEREFQAEVGIISRVHHRHLVALVGYCIADAQRLLVYEFAPNNTLEFHLHGKGRPPLAWSSRLKIAVGSAKGLSYLHENCNPKIIHRDIKAANILLDFKFEAKV